MSVGSRFAALMLSLALGLICTPGSRAQSTALSFETQLSHLARQLRLEPVLVLGPSGCRPASARNEAEEEDPLLQLQIEDRNVAGFFGQNQACSRKAVPEASKHALEPELALKQLLEANGLISRREGELLLITWPEWLPQLRHKDYPLRNAHLSQTDLNALVRELSAIYSRRRIVPIPGVSLDPNTLVLRVVGGPEALDIADQVIPILTRPRPKMLFVVRQIEISRAASEQMGFTTEFNQTPVQGPCGTHFPPFLSSDMLQDSPPEFRKALTSLRQRHLHELSREVMVLEHGFTGKLGDPFIIDKLVAQLTLTPFADVEKRATILKISIDRSDIKTVGFPPISQERLTGAKRSRVNSVAGITMALATYAPGFAMPGRPAIQSEIPHDSRLVLSCNTRSLDVILRVMDGQTVVIGSIVHDDPITPQATGLLPALQAAFMGKTTPKIHRLVLLTPYLLTP